MHSVLYAINYITTTVDIIVKTFHNSTSIHTTNTTIQHIQQRSYNYINQRWKKPRFLAQLLCLKKGFLGFSVQRRLDTTL